MVSGKSEVTAILASVKQKLQTYSDAITLWLQDGKQKNSIFVLDGVRGLACFMVFILHINTIGLGPQVWKPQLQGFIGPLLNALAMPIGTGIVLFFTLSGFLLFLPFAKAIMFDSDWPSLRRFYVRRAFRIIPGYFCALFLMTLFIEPQYLKPERWNEFRLFLVFLMDFPETSQKINAPFWTLAIEFQFYIILPFIALALRAVAKKGTVQARFMKLMGLLFAMMIGGVLLRYWGEKVADTNFLLPEMITKFIKPLLYGQEGKFHEVFAIGMMVCTAYVYMKNRPSTRRAQRMIAGWSPYIFSVGAAVLVFMTLTHYFRYFYKMTLHFFEDDMFTIFLQDWKIWYPICHGIGCGLCLFALLHGVAWLKRPFEWAPLRWLGYISYSFYMWHYPFLFIFFIVYIGKYRDAGWTPLGQYIVYWVFMVVTSVPLAVTLYRVVELPGIRMGEKLCRWMDERKAKKQVVEVEEAVPVPVTSGHR